MILQNLLYQMDRQEEIEEKVHEEVQPSIQKHEERLNPLLYTLFRLDGHSFSKFVKHFKMNLPFDLNFTTAMKNTASESLTYFKFFLGFVGSDEITFAMRPLTEEQIKRDAVLEFNGRVEKMVSLLAGKVSTTFFIELTKLEGFEKTSQFSPHFDCRVFQVKTYKDVLEAVSDRVKYTLKNSRMMLAQTYYSAKQLNKVASKLAVEKLLAEKQIDFETVVHADNRVGNILTFEKVSESKEIIVKNVAKTVTYDRKKVKLSNLSPKQVYELKEEDLI